MGFLTNVGSYFRLSAIANLAHPKECREILVRKKGSKNISRVTVTAQFSIYAESRKSAELLPSARGLPRYLYEIGILYALAASIEST